MSGTTWTKFYWSDWLSDPSLRRCSYAARGLWMDMLCIAATHEPVGVVAVAGDGLGSADLARMTGGAPAEVKRLLGELERCGVFSRDEQGRIYSRRMVQDAARYAEAKENGRKGGNPKLKGGDKPPDKADHKEGVNPPLNGQHNTHIPEARSQSSEDKSSAGSALDEDLDGSAWSEAVKLLTGHGATEASARKLFGKLLSANALMARDLLPAITAAKVNRTGEPQAYLTKSAQGIAKRRTPQPAQRVDWV